MGVGKKFGNSINGFDRHDVITYINTLCDIFDDTLKNRSDTIIALREELIKARNFRMVETFTDVLSAARTAANLMLEDAQRKSESIINEAEIKVKGAEERYLTLKHMTDEMKEDIRKYMEKISDI